MQLHQRLVQALKFGFVMRAGELGFGRQDLLVEDRVVDVLEEAALLGQDRRRAMVDLDEAAIDEEFLAVARPSVCTNTMPALSIATSGAWPASTVISPSTDGTMTL